MRSFANWTQTEITSGHTNSARARATGQKVWRATRGDHPRRRVFRGFAWRRERRQRRCVRSQTGPRRKSRLDTPIRHERERRGKRCGERREGITLVAGYTVGSLGGENAGNVDAFVRKLDPDGNHVWTHQFGTSESDGAKGVASDARGSPSSPGIQWVRLAARTPAT